jgi:IMP dehydrogenase family protein
VIARLQGTQRHLTRPPVRGIPQPRAPVGFPQFHRPGRHRHRIGKLRAGLQIRRFEPAPLINGSRPADLVVADFNRDGLPDIASLNQGNVDVSIALNRGEGRFSVPTHVRVGAAVARVRDAGVTTAVRVSPQNAQALTPTLIAAGIDLLVIQGTIISAERVASDGEPLNLKTFISELDVPVVAGGVADQRTALHLMRTGAAGVIVGYGSTAWVTTSDEVLGISVPMATAIADAAAARREYLDETGGRYVHVLADGDIHTSGELAKAIACGADAVLLGTPLATAAEAPGGGWYWPSAAAHPSLPRGALLEVGVGQRPSLDQVLNGPSDDPFGSLNLVGGLRRSMAKAGYCDLKEFQTVGLTVGS